MAVFIDPKNPPFKNPIPPEAMPPPPTPPAAPPPSSPPVSSPAPPSSSGPTPTPQPPAPISSAPPQTVMDTTVQELKQKQETAASNAPKPAGEYFKEQGPPPGHVIDPVTKTIIPAPKYTEQEKAELRLKAHYASISPAAAFVEQRVMTFFSQFRPETYFARGRGGQERETFKWEAGIYANKDPFTRFISVQIPAYENVILPLATGGAFKYIGAASKTVQASRIAGKELTGIQKAYKYFVKPSQIAIAGVTAGTMGTDIGYTAAKNPSALGPKFLGIGMQLVFMGAGYKNYTPNMKTTPRLTMEEYSNVSPKVEQLDLRTLRYDKVVRPIIIEEFSPNTPKSKGVLTIIESGGRTKTVVEPTTGIVIERPTKLNIKETPQSFKINLDSETITPKKGDVKFLWEKPKIEFQPLQSGGGFRGSGGYRYPGQTDFLFAEDITRIMPKEYSRSISAGLTSKYDPTTAFSISKNKLGGYSLDVSTMIKTDEDIINFSTGRGYRTNPTIKQLRTDLIMGTEGERHTGFSYSKLIGERSEDIMLYRSRDYMMQDNILMKSDRLTTVKTKYPGGKDITGGMLSDAERGTQTFYKSYGVTKLDMQGTRIGRLNTILDKGWSEGKLQEIIPKTKEYYGSGSGFDTTAIQDTILTRQDQIHMPGGTGDFSELGQWNKIDYQGAFPKYGKNIKASLADIEYGVDIRSSYWDGNIPRSNIKDLSISSTDILSATATIQSNLLNQKSMNLQASKNINIQNIVNGIRNDIRQDQRTNQDTRQSIREITDTITTPITIPVTMPVTMPLVFPVITPVVIPRFTPQPPPPNPEVPPFIEIPGVTEDIETKPKSESGYDVYVKERSYVHGKKRIPERWKKANTVPLSEEAALSLGGTAVDQSAAASFKIKEASGKAGKLKIQVDPWETISSKFYKKGNIYIESTSSRIDTSGEIKGISALGWIENQRRGYNNSISNLDASVRTHRQSIPKMRTTSEIRLPNFEKIMRGMGL